MNDIDWSPFDRLPEMTCYCRCGAVFRSHAKVALNVPGLVTRLACPACDKDNDCRRVSSDPETYKIGE